MKDYVLYPSLPTFEQITRGLDSRCSSEPSIWSTRTSTSGAVGEVRLVAAGTGVSGEGGVLL